MTPTEADPILDLIPAGYKGIALAILILTPILGRAYQALKLNGGLKGVWTSIIFGTNTPKLLIGLLCVCSITSCATRADGTATFAGLSKADWLLVSKDAGGAAVKSGAQAALLSYGTRRSMTAAKNPVNVRP